MIAFDGLAFLTGDFGGNTFLPPGKVADFCGFQNMRDVDQNALGHNTSFVPRAANNVLYILTDTQKAKLVALARGCHQPKSYFSVEPGPTAISSGRTLKTVTSPGRRVSPVEICIPPRAAISCRRPACGP